MTPTETTALTPTEMTDTDRRDALLQAVGFDRLSPAQRELALAIANRYELDPMLKHIVMIEGRPYITRDGLLHVAHRSGDFDGMTVADPVMDADPAPDGKRYWRSRATVYRRSFGRPFEYPGRYPADGQNRKYAEEMAIKVAEVMTLRRAFDVSAATLEERWDAPDLPGPYGHDEPETLADRVAQRAEAITVDVAREATAEAVAAEAATIAHDAAEQPTTVDDGPDEIVAAIGPMGAMLTDVVGVDDGPAGPIDVDAFAEWARSPGRDDAMVRATARSLFPDAHGFAELTADNLHAIRAEVERLEAVDAAADAIVVDAATVAPPAEEPTVPAVPPLPDVMVKPTMCGQQSPLSENTCTMDVGHKGVHRAGLKETW